MRATLWLLFSFRHFSLCILERFMALWDSPAATYIPKSQDISFCWQISSRAGVGCISPQNLISAECVFDDKVSFSQNIWTNTMHLGTLEYCVCSHFSNLLHAVTYGEVHRKTKKQQRHWSRAFRTSLWTGSWQIWWHFKRNCANCLLLRSLQNSPHIFGVKSHLQRPRSWEAVLWPERTAVSPVWRA